MSTRATRSVRVIRWITRHRRPVVASLSVMLVLLAITLAIFVLPSLFVPVRLVPQPKDRITLQNNIRTTLIQAIGGFVLLAGGYLTWKSIQVNREGQITERFGRAIDQLASSTLHARLGGIYALERIASNSVRDQEPVMEVLTAFIRTRSNEDQEEPAAHRFYGSGPMEDVHAALRVIARRNQSDQEDNNKRLDLTRSNLAFAHLLQADLTRVDLTEAQLQSANLTQTRLRDAWLVLANLEKASLQEADLRGALLVKANLKNANMRGARLDRAVLNRAQVAGADFTGASMIGTAIKDVSFADAVGVDSDVLHLANTSFDAFGRGLESVQEDSRFEEGASAAPKDQSGPPRDNSEGK
jgi:Pentapeptide repeats (8 copies)